MALLLDTQHVPPHLRVQAVNAALAETGSPARFSATDATDAADVRLRLDCWATGSGSHVLRAVGTGSRFRRTRPRVRSEPAERVAVLLALETGVGLTTDGSESVTASGHLHLVDQTRPFDFSWSGPGGTQAFIVDYDRLSVPARLVRIAAPRIRHSPVYDLVRAHLARLTGPDDDTQMGPARTLVGAASIELLRALVISAADEAMSATDDGRPHRTARDIRHVQITIYIERHLHEPGLCAESIAHAHNISVRQLYKIWAANDDTSLSEWIIAARLEGARRELSRSRAQRTTIGAIARQWGFADPTHFSRRFRAAFGTSPREWTTVHAPQIVDHELSCLFAGESAA